MTSRKRILIVCRKAPYGNSLSREALDIALATSVFDQQLALAFIGDGVWQLLKEQNSEPIAAKNHGKLSEVLALYDINTIYVDEESMHQRNMSTSDLTVTATISNHESLKNLMEQSDIILNF